jgi:hypothetical protein
LYVTDVTHDKPEIPRAAARSELVSRTLRSRDKSPLEYTVSSFSSGKASLHGVTKASMQNKQDQDCMTNSMELNVLQGFPIVRSFPQDCPRSWFGIPDTNQLMPGVQQRKLNKLNSN